MNWFEGIATIEEAKKHYRKLALRYHPDQGGDEDTFKEIDNQFKRLIESFVFASFHTYESNTSKEAEGNAFTFANVLKDIAHFNMRIEIIGYWIYCFESYEYKDILKEKGFWFSKKHRAWVYSGGPKIKKRATKIDVRDIYGSRLLREREDSQINLITN